METPEEKIDNHKDTKTRKVRTLYIAYGLSTATSIEANVANESGLRSTGLLMASL